MDASAAQEQVEVKDSIQKMTEQFKIETTEDEWGYKTYKIFMKILQIVLLNISMQRLICMMGIR